MEACVVIMILYSLSFRPFLKFCFLFLFTSHNSALHCTMVDSLFLYHYFFCITDDFFFFGFTQDTQTIKSNDVIVRKTSLYLLDTQCISHVGLYDHICHFHSLCQFLLCSSEFWHLGLDFILFFYNDELLAQPGGWVICVWGFLHLDFDNLILKIRREQFWRRRMWIKKRKG